MKNAQLSQGSSRIQVSDLDTEVARFIALWMAIHGGDPAPEQPVEIGENTWEAGVAFARQLAEVVSVKAEHPMQFDARISRKQAAERPAAGEVVFVGGADGPPGCCVGHQGGIVCVRLAQ